MADNSRRSFIGYAFGGFAAVGVAAALVPMKKAWDPVPSALSSGFTQVNLAVLEAGKLNILKWRGKPIFVLKKTPEMPSDEKRDVVVGDERFMVAIGLCTHLGCIPTYRESKLDFKCACHGGEFNASGVNTFGPPPRPLDIPPFSQNGNIIVLGEEGPEYHKMVAAIKGEAHGTLS